jgi:hypothetical protein
MKKLKPDNKEKFNIVINKNTFYFKDIEFEEKNEAYIHSLKQNIILLKNRVKQEGLKKEVFVEYIRNSDYGLDALLAITGFSGESLLRLYTFIAVANDYKLNKIVNREKWIKNNEFFAEGIINLFFEGSTVPILERFLPLFEFKKLDINKFNFSLESLIDTIVRYKVKGSYSASKENNPEAIIEKVLKELGCSFEKGELDKIPRTLDFIIPSKREPKIVIECSYVVTTSSGMGDKAKTEQQVSKMIKEHYPETLFIGFIDGIGWYVRKSDLEEMVKAFDFVFTFSKDELNKFRNLLKIVMESRER